jgi:16S rRNA (guanine(1405)-N(7))-methyltransferase
VNPDCHSQEVEGIVNSITRSRKYRFLDLPEDTVRDLVARELPRHRYRADAVKTVKRKLHNIVATYLGDPDYAAAEQELVVAFETAQRDAVRGACASIMSHHSSTRERLPELPDFYRRIFEQTGRPSTVLDIACGLNPLSFPWMGLSIATQYYAYDIRPARIALLNHYFTLQGLSPLARVQDVLVHFPDETGDVALIFKEVHRFEQRERGSSLALMDALRVRQVVVSFPRVNLSGEHDLGTGYRELLYHMTCRRPWKVVELPFSAELVFCIDKSL